MRIARFPRNLSAAETTAGYRYSIEALHIISTVIISMLMSDNAAFLMADTSRLFRRAFDARARCLGVTGQQWRVLVVVSRAPGINQGNAAEQLEFEPITLSRMVDRLQDAGLVERRADPGDRRAWCLHLTERAQPLIEQIRTIAEDLLESAFEGFATDERNSFTDAIERFRANLSRSVETYDRLVDPPVARARHARA